MLLRRGGGDIVFPSRPRWVDVVTFGARGSLATLPTKGATEELRLKLHRIFLHLSAGAVSLAFALLLGSAAEAQVQIQINGQPVNVSPAPVMQAGRVFVPLRGVFESLGASVVYSDGQINATGNGREISLHIGSTQATVDGNPQTIDVAPFIIGASTYVPLRFVSQALGASVDWDGTNQIVAITMQGAPSGYQGAPDGSQGAPNSYEQSGDWIGTPPPPLPDYEPPPVPEPNYIWMPGYWAWGYGGYYYVPGTWVEAPQPGLVWTPGYWGWQNGYYGWHDGYWAQSVGYYGGVYYGGGYYGHGYAGGRWSGDSFQYNTAVVRVNPTIRSVYVDNAVVVKYPTGNHASYNGGPHGITARPTAQETTVTRSPHTRMTTAQQQHVAIAGQDRSLLSSVNKGKPPLVVTTHALTAATKPTGFVPLTAGDKTAAQKLIVHPTARPAVVVPVKTAPPSIARPTPPVREPLARPTPTHPVAVPTAPVREPLVRPTPAHPAVVPTAPVRQPLVRPTPTRPAVVPTAPVRQPLVRPTPPRPAILPAATARPVPAATPRPVPTPRPVLVRPAPTPAPVIRTARPEVVQPPPPTRPPVIHTLPPRPLPTEAPKPKPSESP
jgi:hypothetical protein